ncbi:hypothetical protein [Actibacterium sp. D379-3]
MKPPQAFYDFTLQFHQDLDLVYPGWASEDPNARWGLYEDFRQGFGDRAVEELAAYFRRLLNDKNADLESIWFKESKADWIISGEGIRRLFEDFQAWASSLR